VTDQKAQKKAAEKRELEAAKQDVVQVDDLLTFRQFTKKAADDALDVCIFST
jgi:coatomer subunit beta